MFTRTRSSRRRAGVSLALLGAVALLGAGAGGGCGGHPGGVGGGPGDLAPPSVSDLGAPADLAQPGGPTDASQPVDASPPQARKLGGNALVSGGDRSASPHYTLIHTLGQPTQNQQKTVSPGYRLQGGLSGATGR